MDDSDSEEFGFENGNYRQFFHMTWDWPCLSFDVLRDDLGASRLGFPHTAYFVSATQTAQEEEDGPPDDDQLLVTRLSKLAMTKHDDQQEPTELPDPEMHCCASVHPTPATRIRSMPQQPAIVATWGELGVVYVWDVTASIVASNTPDSQGATTLIFECPIEDTGFGLAWSKIDRGVLAVGQDRGLLTVWSDAGGGFTRTHLYESHSAGVEDIVFSPNDAGILATCSGDKTIAVWDLRSPEPVMRIAAHACDVNVIDWNPLQPNLICSGADDGAIRVWDLRAISAETPEPAAEIRYHEEPITSIEWNPADESEFAVACEDGRVTLWDLSVEAADIDQKMDGIHDQLLFEHAFDEPKELHYHPQIPSMVAVTGLDGFDVFIPDIEGDAGEGGEAC
jgi:ribosome assembly protein RRB1